MRISDWSSDVCSSDLFVIGMAHRGRLNVISNILGKSYESIFSEFEGKTYSEEAEQDFGGDVKYHLGYSTDITTENDATVHLSLVPKPSHLETVAPVVAIGSASCRERLCQYV